MCFGRRAIRLALGGGGAGGGDRVVERFADIFGGGAVPGNWDYGLGGQEHNDGAGGCAGGARRPKNDGYCA